MPALRLLATPCMLIATPPSPASHTPHTRPHTHNAMPPGHGHHDHGQERVGPRGGGRRAAGAVPSSQHACAWMCVTPCGITSTAPAFSGISQCCARQRACTAACCTPALCCTSPLRTCRAALHSSQAFALCHIHQHTHNHSHNPPPTPVLLASRRCTSSTHPHTPPPPPGYAQQDARQGGGRLPR